MNKIQIRLLFLSCLWLPILVGCSNKVGISGRITFPDGSPLTSGIVYFDNGITQAYGMIDAEGKYELGEVKDKEGIKPGPYKVRIFAQQGGTSDGKPLVFLIDPKFSNTETSGLSCEVKRGGRFDFTVERFKKK